MATSTSKKAKYACRYNKDWEKKFTFVTPVKHDINSVHCTLCKKTFSIAAGGLNDITRHSHCKKHKEMVNIVSTTRPLMQTYASQDMSSKVSK